MGSPRCASNPEREGPDPATRRYRVGIKPPKTRHLLIGLAAGVVAAVAVPAAEAAVIFATARPVVPGPHDQDGVYLHGGDVTAPVPFVWLGDSLASGVGAESAATSFPHQSVTIFGAAQRRSVHLTCLARPGSCAADVLADQVPDAVASLGPGGVAVITVGANDVGSLTRPRQFVREYTAILQAMVATGATVVAVGLPDMGAAMVMPQPLRAIAGWVGRRADRQVRSLAALHGAHYINIDLRPGPGSKHPAFLAADRWHPNGATYEMWADRFAEFVHPLLHRHAA